MTWHSPIKARRNQGSAPFIWTNAGSVTPGVKVSADWETYKASSGFYLPFNYTRITNNSSADIIFYPNQDTTQGIIVPAGSNTSIDADIVPALYSFSILNNSSTQTITANQITVLSSKVAGVQ